MINRCSVLAGEGGGDETGTIFKFNHHGIKLKVIFIFCDDRNNLHEAEIVRKEAGKHLDKIHDICPVTCKNACFVPLG